jgi:uncharacterized protein (DUF1778 family)
MALKSKPKMGRPSVIGGSPTVLTLRLSRGQHAVLKRAAGVAGQTISAFARDLLAKQVKIAANPK